MQGQKHRKGRVCLDSSRGKGRDARTVPEEREETQGQFQRKGKGRRRREGHVRTIPEVKEGDAGTVLTRKGEGCKDNTKGKEGRCKEGI